MCWASVALLCPDLLMVRVGLCSVGRDPMEGRGVLLRAPCRAGRHIGLYSVGIFDHLSKLLFAQCLYRRVTVLPFVTDK